MEVVSARPDPRAREIVKELKEQNSQLTHKIEKMENQLDTLLALVSDLHQKIK